MMPNLETTVTVRVLDLPEAKAIVVQLRDLARLGEAALAWNWLRRVAVRLKDDRNRCECEENNGDPCWKPDYEYDEDGNATRLPSPIKGWCEPCQRRQDTHAALRLVVGKRGVAHRRLQAIAKGLNQSQ